MHSASFNICQCTASLVLLYLSPKFPLQLDYFVLCFNFFKTNSLLLLYSYNSNSNIFRRVRHD